MIVQVCVAAGEGIFDERPEVVVHHAADGRHVVAEPADAEDLADLLRRDGGHLFLRLRGQGG
ncbi:hypothetical protein D3C87_1891530 [compost metagenome]